MFERKLLDAESECFAKDDVVAVNGSMQKKSKRNSERAKRLIPLVPREYHRAATAHSSDGIVQRRSVRLRIIG